MRILFIRHSKSTNNEIPIKDKEAYIKQRTSDPDLSINSSKQCEKLGNILKQKNIKIDKFYVSPHIKALKTLLYISKTYDESNSIKKILFPICHEYGGIYDKSNVYTGLNEKEIKEIIPEIDTNIYCKEEGYNIENGWYTKDHIETKEELKERIKKCFNIFKNLASQSDNINKTIAIISHGNFLNYLFSWYICSGKCDNETLLRTDNLSLSSLVIDEHKNINIEFINYNILD